MFATEKFTVAEKMDL